MRLDLCLCGPRRAAATPLALDAAPRAKTSDPTGTLPLQRDFDKEMNKRWDALRRVVPSLVNARTNAASTIEHAAITGQDPVRAFQLVIDRALKMVVVAPARKWMLPYVRNASDLAIARATDHMKNMTTDGYDPDEPRDDDGKWTTSGGNSAPEMSDDEVSKLEPRWEKITDKKKLANMQSAVATYTGSEYDEINSELRKPNDDWTTGPYQTPIRRLTSVFQEAGQKLPEDRTLYRGVSERRLGGLKPGDVVTEPAFMSTSNKKSTAENFTGGTGRMLHLTVPKGTRVIAPLFTHHVAMKGPDADVMGEGAESEVLLRRNTSYRVDRVEGRNIYATVLKNGYLDDGGPFIFDAAPQRDRVPPLQTLAHTELQGIAEAVSQQAVRAFADGLMQRKTPGAIARDVQAIVDKVGKSRSALLVGFIVMRAFSAATLDTFRAAGITHVGTKPESRPARITTDAKKSKAPKGKDLSKIYRQERKIQALGEVDVLTAGDDNVCPICEDISDEGPYDIDTAETLIPAHPNCRCAFVPANDMRFAHDSQTHTAAGIMFHDQTGRVLFVRRSDNSDHPGEWCFPGGAVEPGETAEMAARREAQEEVGYTTDLPLEQVDRRELGGVDFTTFVVEVPEPFAPVLDSEHTDAAWRMPTDAPEPLHPGVRATIDAALTLDEFNPDQPRDKYGKWTETGAESANAKASAFAETLKSSGVDNVETYHDKANGVHKVFVNMTNEGAHESFMSASLKHGVPLEHTEIHGDTLAAKFQESNTTPEQKLDKAVAHLSGEDAEESPVHKNEDYENYETGENQTMYEVKSEHADEFEQLAKQAGVEVQNIGQLTPEGSHVGYTIIGHAQSTPATQPTTAPNTATPNEINFEDLTKIDEQKGSNTGGVFENEETGQKYYIKSMDEAHAKNERLAASLYQLAGASTLDYVDVAPDTDTGTHYVATKFENLDKDNVSQFTPVEREFAQKNFAVHAWLANWDAAGTGGDNQGFSNNQIKTLDVGGALEYRAQGAPKGDKFGTNVEEFNTLRDPKKNKDAANLFGDMTNEQIKESVEKVASIPDHTIRDAVLKGGGTEALADKLIARKNDLNIRAAALGNQTLEKAIGTPTTTPAPISTTSTTVDHPAKIFKSQVSGNSSERIEWRKQLKSLPYNSEEAKQIKLKIIASFWKHYDKLSKTNHPKASDIASKLGQYALKYKIANPLTTPSVSAPTPKPQVATPTASQPTTTPAPTTFFKPPPGPDLSTMTEDQVRVHMLDKVTHGGASWVKSGATVLQKSAKLQKAGLTASEIAYVRAFTGPYSGLNKQLRDGHMSEEVFYFKHIMNDALEKFPAYDGDKVWRKVSVSDSVLKNYDKVGSIVHWPAFSSTAKNPNVWSGNTQFVIHRPKTGRDVQGISVHSGEAEVVMPADTYYKVLAPPTMKKCEDGVTRNVVELEEVVPFGKQKKARAA